MDQMLTGDARVRAAVDGLPVYEFPTVAYTAPKPLAEARVAIVTTAGLRTDGALRWMAGDQSFTVIPDPLPSGQMAPVGETGSGLGFGHMSPNFDRSGFTADANVVFPIDRLHELAEQGVIGSVAPRHVSFMGAQLDHELSTMRLDTGPAAAKLLLDDKVDVVLLTPV
jgi:D-proline reductase (dithiol) PrdB